MPTWGTEQDAVPLTDPGGATGAAVGTSTSTRLMSSGGSWPAYYLRMYGLGEGGIQLAGAADAAVWSGEGAESYDVTACSTYDAAAFTDQWITFIDGEPKAFFGGVLTDADMSFAMAPPDDPSVALVSRTCIPGFKTGAGWPYAHRVYAAGSPCTYQTYEYDGDFLVLYKDVCVVRMPSDALGGIGGGVGAGNGDDQNSAGYLMIAVRVRVLVEDLENNPPTGTDPRTGEPYLPFDANNPMASASWSGFGSPGRSLSDIVCWYASDPEFRVDVAGPFMLVHSSYALDVTPHARLWLGVPGGVWVKTDGDVWLYVYYMCEPADDRTNLTEKNNYQVFEDTQGCTGSASESYTGVADEVDAPDQELDLDVKAGIAVKRFRIADIKAQIVAVAAAGAVIPEVDWTIYRGTGWTPVSGEALGYISIWFAGGSAIPAGEVSAWETVMPMYAVAAPKTADPMPLLCRRRLTLYFAAIHQSSGAFDVFSYTAGTTWSGHGIWRTTALKSGEVIFDGTSSYTVGAYGVHFVASADTDGRDVLFESQVIHAKSDLTPYYDPDPVVLPDQSVRVFFGQGGTPGTLQYVSGSHDDVCFDDTDLLAVAPAAAVVGSPPAGMPPGRGRDAMWLNELTGRGAAVQVALPPRR